MKKKHSYYSCTGINAVDGTSSRMYDFCKSDDMVHKIL